MAGGGGGEDEKGEDTMKLRATAVGLLLFLMLLTVSFEFLKGRMEHGISHLYQVMRHVNYVSHGRRVAIS